MFTLTYMNTVNTGGYSFIHYENDRWGIVYFYTKIPNDIQEGDIVELSIWNATQPDMYIDWTPTNKSKRQANNPLSVPLLTHATA